MIKLILILTIISNLALAQDAQLLTKGQPAPFTGDLLTLDQTKNLYNDSLAKTSLQKQLDLETQNNGLLTQENTILQTQNDKLMKQNQDQKAMSDLEKGLWCLGGIVLTSLAVKGAASLHP